MTQSMKRRTVVVMSVVMSEVVVVVYICKDVRIPWRREAGPSASRSKVWMLRSVSHSWNTLSFWNVWSIAL